MMNRFDEAIKNLNKKDLELVKDIMEFYIKKKLNRLQKNIPHKKQQVTLDKIK